MDKEYKEAFGELKTDIKEVNTGLNDVKLEQASFKAEVITNLKQGHGKFADIKSDTEGMKDTLQEIQMNNIEQEVRLENAEKELEKLKNNKLKDRLTAGSLGGGGGLIMSFIKTVFGIGE